MHANDRACATATRYRPIATTRVQNPAFISFEWGEPSGKRHPQPKRSLRSLIGAQDGSAWTNSEQKARAESTPGGIQGLSRRARRLLNLEKIMFVSDEDGHAPGVLLLSAKREGFHRDGPDGGSALLIYNIGECSSERAHVMSCMCQRCDQAVLP